MPRAPPAPPRAHSRREAARPATESLLRRATWCGQCRASAPGGGPHRAAHEPLRAVGRGVDRLEAPQPLDLRRPVPARRRARGIGLGRRGDVRGPHLGRHRLPLPGDIYNTRPAAVSHWGPHAAQQPAWRRTQGPVGARRVRCHLRRHRPPRLSRGRHQRQRARRRPPRGLCGHRRDTLLRRRCRRPRRLRRGSTLLLKHTVLRVREAHDKTSCDVSCDDVIGESPAGQPRPRRNGGGRRPHFT